MFSLHLIVHYKTNLSNRKTVYMKLPNLNLPAKEHVNEVTHEQLAALFVGALADLILQKTLGIATLVNKVLANIEAHFSQTELNEASIEELYTFVNTIDVNQELDKLLYQQFDNLPFTARRIMFTMELMEETTTPKLAEIFCSTNGEAGFFRSSPTTCIRQHIEELEKRQVHGNNLALKMAKEAWNNDSSL